MLFEDLSNEIIEKLKSCTTKEEADACLKENNIESSGIDSIQDDDLDEVAGGADKVYCSASPYRMHVVIKTGKIFTRPNKPGKQYYEWKCPYCNQVFTSKVDKFCD